MYFLLSVIPSAERYLVYMGLDFLSVDQVLGDSILIDAHRNKDIEHPRMNVSTAIGDDAHDDFLPSILSPYSAPGSGAEMCDVAHNPMHCSRKEDLVLVVHGDGDEELCFPAEEGRS